MLLVMLYGATTSAGKFCISCMRRVLISSHRHLSFIRNAFAGIPTMVKEIISAEEAKKAVETSDILFVPVIYPP